MYTGITRFSRLTRTSALCGGTERRLADGKGLGKYPSPFTPDQSGVSVLFHYGGMPLIMDAGGCVGNICDTMSRVGIRKEYIFSAALVT